MRLSVQHDRMMGRKVWDNVFCSCCNPPKERGQIRMEERAIIQEEIEDATTILQTEPA